jgi:hypothetical protein
MFGLWKKKQPIDPKHWYVVLPDFAAITSEFYDAIEYDLKAREITGMEISRIEYAEGGMFSAKREYLRMRRERLVFDVCAAPCGTSWFFSYRFGEIPLEIHLWEVLVLLIGLTGIVWFYTSLFGIILGLILFAASLLSLLLIMRNTVSLGMQDLDAALLQVPIVGAFYQRFLRKDDTYYRQDTRLAYRDIVDDIIRARINEVGAAGGVKLVEFKDATPPSHPGMLSMIAGILRLGR